MSPDIAGHKTLFFAIFLIFAAVLIQCSSALRPGLDKIPPRDTVWIQGESFQPNIIRVNEGARVIWTNRDGETHTVTEGLNRSEGEFESGDIRSGGAFTHTFYDAGVYYYYCRYHPDILRGVVIVGVEKRDDPF
jgi:hypothetical protein